MSSLKKGDRVRVISKSIYGPLADWMKDEIGVVKRVECTCFAINFPDSLKNPEGSTYGYAFERHDLIYVYSKIDILFDDILKRICYEKG